MNRHRNSLRSKGALRWQYRVWWSQTWGQARCKTCFLWHHVSWWWGRHMRPIYPVWRHACLWSPGESLTLLKKKRHLRNDRRQKRKERKPWR